MDLREVGLRMKIPKGCFNCKWALKGANENPCLTCFVEDERLNISYSRWEAADESGHEREISKDE